MDRIRGLKPGQHWRVPVFDPLVDAIQALIGGGGGPELLDARVLEEPESFTWGRRRNEECLVVEYQGEDKQLRTWVHRRNGLVLRQEMTLNNTHWTMNRE
jgi:hypothetical protein